MTHRAGSRHAILACVYVSDARIVGNAGTGGQGLLPIPVVYNGWVQNLPPSGKIG